MHLHRTNIHQDVDDAIDQVADRGDVLCTGGNGDRHHAAQ